MKKYVKPELFYERYELSQHVAACIWDMTLQTNTATCYGNSGIPNYNLFLLDSGLCQTNNPADGIYCETNGAGEKVTFAS